jgi:formyltetrahydrofolate deformylase
MKSDLPTATLLVSCPDQKGLVAKIANFIYSHDGNIIHADQHTDFNTGLFLTRVEWQLDGFALTREEIAPAFAQFCACFVAKWQLFFSDRKPRMSIWVSKQEHCLLDLLWRSRSGEFAVDVPLIISNHPDLQYIADQFGIDYCHIPITKDNKSQQEAQQLEMLQKYQIDLVVLAKYMQVVTPNFINQFGEIINIHHSFLPAFVGANAYQKAYQRGVKIIGATAHYVTDDLDAGPIIEQDIINISHRDDVKDLICKGKDLERLVLARAVKLHLQNRILVYGNRTVVFK